MPLFLWYSGSISPSPSFSLIHSIPIALLFLSRGCSCSFLFFILSIFFFTCCLPLRPHLNICFWPFFLLNRWMSRHTLLVSLSPLVYANHFSKAVKSWSGLHECWLYRAILYMCIFFSAQMLLRIGLHQLFVNPSLRLRIKSFLRS